MHLPSVIVAAGVLAAAVGCANPVPATSPPAGPVTGSAPGAPPSGEPTELVVYSGRSESLVGGMIEDFKRDSGVDVSVRWGESGELAAVLLEEGSASEADVFLAQDPGALGAVEAMFAPIPEAMTEHVAETLLPASGLWAPLTGRARVIVYNTDTVSADTLPASLDDLVAPEWKSRVGWAPTNSSFQAMVTAMRTLWGAERTKSWLEAMLANEVSAYDGNAPIVAAVGAGEIDVGLVNHYYLYRFLAEEGPSFTASNHFLRDAGPGSLLLVSGAGILSSTRHANAAEQFVTFMLSAATQQRFVDETQEYSVLIGSAPPPNLPPLGDLGAPAIEVADLADLAGSVALLRDVGALP